MSGSPDRDTRLSELRVAIDTWAVARIAQLTTIVASQKKIIDARGTPAQSASSVGASIVATSLKEFTG